MSSSNLSPRSVVKNVKQDGNTVVLDLAGDIDLHCATDLRGQLLETLQKKPHNIIIDMSEVAFMDSSGLATLVEALQLSRRYQGKLKLVGMQNRVRSIFEISKLDSIFQIYQTQAEAMA
jgi:anti-sigma B factor antagonist